MNSRNWILTIFGLGAFLGLGVIIGWFSKPGEKVEQLDTFTIIDDFASRVSSEDIGNEIETISKEIRYATAQGLNSRSAPPADFCI